MSAFEIKTKETKLGKIIIIEFPHFTEIVDVDGFGLDVERIAARVSKKTARQVARQVAEIWSASASLAEKRSMIKGGADVVEFLADNTPVRLKVVGKVKRVNMHSSGRGALFGGGVFVPGADSGQFYWVRRQRRDGSYRKGREALYLGAGADITIMR